MTMSTVPFNEAEAATLLTVREVAAKLRMSVTSVYRLVDRRAIRFFRCTRSLRFRPNDVDAFVATHAHDVEKGGDV